MIKDNTIPILKMGYLESIFGRNAQSTVLEYLIKKKGDFTYLSGIAEDTGLSHSSVGRVIDPLIKNNIVLEKKLGKQIRTFIINEEDTRARLIIKFYYDLKSLDNGKEPK